MECRLPGQSGTVVPGGTQNRGNAVVRDIPWKSKEMIQIYQHAEGDCDEPFVSVKIEEKPEENRDDEVRCS